MKKKYFKFKHEKFLIFIFSISLISLTGCYSENAGHSFQSIDKNHTQENLSSEPEVVELSCFQDVVNIPGNPEKSEERMSYPIIKIKIPQNKDPKSLVKAELWVHGSPYYRDMTDVSWTIYEDSGNNLITQLNGDKSKPSGLSHTVNSDQKNWGLISWNLTDIVTNAIEQNKDEISFVITAEAQEQNNKMHIGSNQDDAPYLHPSMFVEFSN